MLALIKTSTQALPMRIRFYESMKASKARIPVSGQDFLPFQRSKFSERGNCVLNQGGVMTGSRAGPDARGLQECIFLTWACCHDRRRSTLERPFWRQPTRLAGAMTAPNRCVIMWVCRRPSCPGLHSFPPMLHIVMDKPDRTALSLCDCNTSAS